MSAVCWNCGTTEAETYRFCSVRKEFVCLNCERSCPSYSRVMLPNGTHCMEAYKREVGFAERQLDRRFLSLKADVDKAKEYWEERNPEDAYSLLAKAIAKYDDSVDPKYRSNACAHITALQLIIKERRERDAG